MEPDEIKKDKAKKAKLAEKKLKEEEKETVKAEAKQKADQEQQKSSQLEESAPRTTRVGRAEYRRRLLVPLEGAGKDNSIGTS